MVLNPLGKHRPLRWILVLYTQGLSPKDSRKEKGCLRTNLSLVLGRSLREYRLLFGESLASMTRRTSHLQVSAYDTRNTVGDSIESTERLISTTGLWRHVLELSIEGAGGRRENAEQIRLLSK